MAALRSLEVGAVPEELQAEPLNRLFVCLTCNVLLLTDFNAPVLIVRVLYRLRSLAEQTPFDAATFSYAFPLLARVLLQGGIGIEEEEGMLEQVALVLDIIKFHCGECM